MITKEQIKEDKITREDNCKKELEQLLEKYNCKIESVLSITSEKDIYSQIIIKAM